MDFDEQLATLRMQTEVHLDEVSDLATMVLKGHLLAEQALYSTIKAFVANPEYIDDARFRFPQLIGLARALFPKETDAKRVKVDAMYWDALHALNALRNKFAHQLEPVELGDLLRRLFVSNPTVENPFENKDVINDIGVTVSFVIGLTMGMAAKVRKL